MRLWQDWIGYVPQATYFADDSFRRTIPFGLSDEEIDQEAVTKAIRSAQLEGFVAILPG